MKTIPNIKELNGARVLERGTKFLAKQIILHMQILALYKKVKPLRYSHAETLIWSDARNQLYTIGSRKDGAREIKVQDYYTKGHELRVLIPRVPLTRQQTIDLWQYQLTIKDNPY